MFPQKWGLNPRFPDQTSNWCNLYTKDTEETVSFFKKKKLECWDTYEQNSKDSVGADDFTAELVNIAKNAVSIFYLKCFIWL